MTSELDRLWEANERAKRRKHERLDREQQRREKLHALNAADEA